MNGEGRKGEPKGCLVWVGETGFKSQMGLWCEKKETLGEKNKREAKGKITLGCGGGDIDEQPKRQPKELKEIPGGPEKRVKRGVPGIYHPRKTSGLGEGGVVRAARHRE